jgi:hypothetical protein
MGPAGSRHDYTITDLGPLRPEVSGAMAATLSSRTICRVPICPRVLRVVRRERLTTVAASLGCWHARPSNVSALLALRAGMLILAASIDAWHNQAYVTDGGCEAGTRRAISADMLGNQVTVAVARRRAEPGTCAQPYA